MAKERVQVQGLGDVVPGIQPTIQRAGQYAVAQVRAAPVPVPRSKLLDLADTLKVGQDLLQQYGQAAEQEAQMFEEELSRKSPEEVQAMLKKTEGELDKQVRRGAMGWLTSPLNQKRKLRAVGQASSRLLMEQVYNRLDNPEAGDEDLSTREVINLVQQNFVNSNEALSGSMFAQEGLQESVNPQILPLVRQYDAQKNRVAKGDTAFGTTNVFYELAKDGSNLGEYDEETTQALLGSWENLSAFSANEQRDILGKVFENLAKNGMEEKADSLLLWASKNIKIGASKMTELEYDGYSTMIERTAEVAGNLEEKNRADKVEEQAAKFRIAHNDIQRTGSGTYNGQEYTDLVSLQQAAEQAPEFDDDVRGKADLQKQIDGIVKSDVDPVTMYVNEIFRNPFAQGAIKGGMQEIDRAFDTTLSSSQFDTEVALSDPEILRIKSEADAQFQQSLNQELRRIAQLPEGRDSMNASQLVNEFVIKEKERISREMDRKVQIRLDKLSERAERTNTRVTEKDVAPEDSFFDDIGDTLEKTIQANNVLLNLNAEKEEKKKALKYFRNIDLNELANIASGQRNKGKLVRSFGPFDPIEGTVVGNYYTPKEKDEALQNYMKGAALSTEFTKQEVIDNGVTSHGVRFDIKQIDPARVRLLTDEEIAEVKDITDLKSTNKTFLKVKELAKKLGADDVFEVITKQQRLLKALADL
jgi:hypothetical protein